MQKQVLQAMQLRCYPTDEQRQILAQWFGNSRHTYNVMLNKALEQKRATNHWPSRFAMNNWLPQMKQSKPFLKYSEASSLQTTAEFLHRGFVNWFEKRAKKPRKKKKKWSQTLTIVNNHNLRFENSHAFHIPKMKTPLMISSAHRPIGKIKRVTLKLSNTGKYYLIILFEKQIHTLPKTGRTVGLDAGLRFNQILSTGLKIKALHFQDLDHRIKIAQRQFVKAKHVAIRECEQAYQRDHKLGLKTAQKENWALRPKVVIKRQHLARLHRKLANKRKDFLQKLSTYLVKHFDVISIEKLHVKNMLKDHHRAKAISEQGWSMFHQMLAYKCQWYGKTLRYVTAAYTTQTCSDCGYVCNREDGTWIESNVESWTCPKCHHWHDRDVNAALNIEKRPAIEIING